MYLNASSNTDTLSVNLGRDKTIVLTRKKLKEKFKIYHKKIKDLNTNNDILELIDETENKHSHQPPFGNMAGLGLI